MRNIKFIIPIILIIGVILIVCAFGVALSINVMSDIEFAGMNAMLIGGSTLIILSLLLDWLIKDK